MLESIIAGFDDYTNDQRGDVGSWVRLAAIASISNLFAAAFERLVEMDLLTQERLDRIVAALLKQGVERLDNVREASGVVLEMIAGAVAVQSSKVELRGRDQFRKLRFVFRSASLDVALTLQRLSHVETGDMRDFTATSIRILPFLAIPEYRFAILEGATLSVVGSSRSPLTKTETDPDHADSTRELITADRLRNCSSTGFARTI